MTDDAEDRSGNPDDADVPWVFVETQPPAASSDEEEFLSSTGDTSRADVSLVEQDRHLLAKQNRQHAKQDYGLKKWLFWWVLAVVSIQLLFAMDLVVRVGEEQYKLSDGVIIAFLTGTTIEVLGLAFIVARHLFPTGKDED